MKTLDEVIFNFEYTTANGTLMMVDRDDFADALEYLKEYREKQEAMRRREIRLERAIASYNDNPPLTWDELREMEGKPVWIEAGDYTGWKLIDCIDNEEIILRERDGYFISLLVGGHGKTWQAYRKERE